MDLEFAKLTSDRKKQVYYLVFIMISALFVMTRLFRLDSVPFTSVGIELDEIGAAYDAWGIQGWGVDRYLTKCPVYFLNTGDGQNALYIYLAALMFKLFGFSVFKFRLVAVICASFAYICLFFLARLIFKDSFLSLLPNALMTILPVFMMSEHWGLEAYLYLSFSMISFYFMVYAIRSEKIVFYILTGILWGLTFYTYGVSYVGIPLFMIFSLAYLLYLKKIKLSQVIATALPMVLLGIPLLVEQLVIRGVIEPFSLKYMDFFPMKRQRWSDISFSYLGQNLMHAFRSTFVNDYCFYNSSPWFGSLYYISLPFLAIGLVLTVRNSIKAIKEKQFDISVLLLLFYIATRFVSLIGLYISFNTSNAVYFPYLMFIAFGIIYTVKKINRKAYPIVLAGLYAVTFLVFAKWMYSNGEFSWNHYSRPRTEEYIVVNIQPGYAVGQIVRDHGDKHIQMIMNDVEGRYEQICLFAGTSPFDYNTEGYSENGYDISIPEELDLSGDTAYLIEDELHHITDYLVSEGFMSEPAERGGFTIVYK